jgi:predicted neuraminidase
MRAVWDGSRWKDAGLFLANCMNNYPPRLLGGRLFMTCRDSYAAMHTALADSPKGDQWKVTKLPGQPPHDRMSEPSWYVDPQGIAHMIFRDGRSSKYLYRSLSRDQGRTWSAPVRTNYPDATSKNIAGRLSNGWYFLINNPNQQGRDPLAISFSRDGWTFDNPVALRKNAPERRFEGRSKSNRSFQYPHLIERNGSLWVIYATNKEDIEISEFPIAAFGLSK